MPPGRAVPAALDDDGATGLRITYSPTMTSRSGGRSRSSAVMAGAVETWAKPTKCAGARPAGLVEQIRSNQVCVPPAIVLLAAGAAGQAEHGNSEARQHIGYHCSRVAAFQEEWGSQPTTQAAHSGDEPAGRPPPRT